MADEVRLEWQNQMYRLVRINRVGTPIQEGDFADLSTIETHVKHIQADTLNPIEWRVYPIQVLMSKRISPGTNHC